MTTDRSPAEAYFDEVRIRADAFRQALRPIQSGGTQNYGGALRVALANILPIQYGVAGGAVVSSNRKLDAIAIEGALIHDQTQNSPLFQSTGGDLFPIETVLGVVSGIEILDDSGAKVLAAAVAPIRQMARRGKFYQSYEIVRKPNGKCFGNLREYRSDLPPRAYLIAGTLGWNRPDTAVKALKTMLERIDDSHLDGLLVLDADWFLHQPDNKRRIEVATDDGAIRFVQKLVADMAGAESGALSALRYAPD